MPTLFEAAVATLLEVEGGYVDDPRDSGGRTKYGISQRAYPHLDIPNLTREEAVRIYDEDYWARIPIDLPDDVRWFAFDAAVNHGVSRALAWLKAYRTLDALVSVRLDFYAGLSTFPTFGRGWTRRVAHVLDAIDKWKTAHATDETSGFVPTLVLHDLPLAQRWVALVRGPAVLRGRFKWTLRPGKLDVRRMG